MDIGEIFVRRGLLSSNQLDAVRSAGGDGARLVESVVERGLISEEDALRAIGAEVGLDFVDLATTLARRGRSTGFRLIITAQEPVVDQIPASVRANCLTTIAFKQIGRAHV